MRSRGLTPASSLASSCWPFALRRLAHGRLVALPLDSVAAMQAEGFGRAQIAEWMPRCAAGRLRVFVVRDTVSGRRAAHFGLRCVVESALWVLEFHSMRPGALRSVLELLADVQIAYQERTAGRPHAALGSQEAVRALLVQMDEEDVARSMDDQRSGVVIWQSDAELAH